VTALTHHKESHLVYRHTWTRMMPQPSLLLDSNNNSTVLSTLSLSHTHTHTHTRTHTHAHTRAHTHTDKSHRRTHSHTHVHTHTHIHAHNTYSYVAISGNVPSGLSSTFTSFVNSTLVCSPTILDPQTSMLRLPLGLCLLRLFLRSPMG
jgi:hypothetical protein